MVNGFTIKRRDGLTNYNKPICERKFDNYLKFFKCCKLFLTFDPNIYKISGVKLFKF